MMRANILLVEDNVFDAKVFRFAAEEAGIEAPITIARDGVEAMAVLRDRQIETDLIVVTDLNMPRMSGIELLRTIRETDELADLPVFVVTTSNLPSDHDEAVKLGINGYIRKTGDEQDLIEPIVAFLTPEGGQTS